MGAVAVVVFVAELRAFAGLALLGRVLLSHWGTTEIVAVDLDGKAEVVGHGPEGLGWATEWLPDGRMLLTGSALLRQEPDGTMVRHAELPPLASAGWSEVTVDVPHAGYP